MIFDVTHNVIHSLIVLALCGVTFFAWIAWASSPRGLKRELEDLALLCGDLDERLASLHASHRKMNSRLAMREARAARAEQVDAAPNGGGSSEAFKIGANETVEQWKARCRRGMAAGALKHD